MSKFDKDKVMPRYFLIAVVLTIIGIAVLGRALYIMIAQKDYWEVVADKLKVVNRPDEATRGNILSCDGQLMATSIPEYKIFMDYRATEEDTAWCHKRDTLWNEKLDSLCDGLHDIFPSMTAAEFKARLQEGKRLQKRHWPVYKQRLDYNTFCRVKQLPFFNLGRRSGFHYDEEKNARRRPFRSLAQRTVGDMYGGIDSARCGLELFYDSILRGTPGIKNRIKVLNRYTDIPVQLPIDGCDIITTIDVNMQDIAERAVIDQMKVQNCDLGVAILMEVETGDVKAIVNMTRLHDKQGNPYYAEIKNNAIADLREPGSVFKTASMMVALEDGVVDTNYVQEACGGTYKMHGRDMRDHNWRNGGYGRQTFSEIVEHSSNIGVSRIIDSHYGHRPEKFVKGIYRTGLADDLHLPLYGYAKPRIRMPKKNSRNQYTNWSKTALPWMSIGYETQIPPISTVTFYNAIANGGKMMRPRFIKSIVKNGEVIEEFEPVVQREQICSPKTLKKMQTILERVVTRGTGKKAGSRTFRTAGKTGTAQIAEGGGYKTGTVKYWLSFAGYFPADAPRYSCIVCLKKAGIPASGGFSAEVFHHISEGVMARYLKRDVKSARDTTSILIPDVKNGNVLAADYVLGQLDIKTSNGWDGSYASGNPIWGTATRQQKEVALGRTKTADNITPDVTGMGARDAVYLLESRGLRVRMNGRGRVVKQSYPAGRAIARGSECVLTMN